MSKWCLNHKKDLPDFLFFPDAPDRALCKECIKSRVRGRNKEIFQEADRRKREQVALLELVRQYQPDNEPFIYLIEHDNRYKIGFSKNISKRLRSFNTAHATHCKIVAIAPGTKELEKDLHKKFSTHHISGEWFLKKPAIVQYIESLVGSMIFLPGYLKQEGSPPSC